MKKFLLSIAAMSLASAACAEVVFPHSFTSDFAAAYQQNLTVPEGFTTYGQEGKVTDETLSKFFGQYSPTNAFRLLGWGTGNENVSCFSPSMVVFDNEIVPSNEWLVSPEIEVQEDMEMIYFEVATYLNSASNKFLVYLSEEGPSKEAFLKNEPVLTATLRGTDKSINTGTRRIVLEGYKGKKINVAIVNSGNAAGMLGFANLRVAPYYIEVLDAEALDDVVVYGDDQKLSFKVNMSTPVSCVGLKAVLETESGLRSETALATTFSKSKVSTVMIAFPDALQVEGAEAYTVTITPNMEGAEPTVIKGRLIKGHAVFNPSAVVEEATGSWCGWCPRGIAFMNYYTDKYNSLGKGKVIPILVHNGDRMDAPYDYFDLVAGRMMKYVSSFGFPMAMVNRVTAGDPGEVDVDGVMTNTMAYGKTNIAGVQYDPANPRSMTVRCNTATSFTVDNPGLSMALVLVENGVKGNTSDWDQQDYYGQYGMSTMEKEYGAEIAPYFKDFVNRPSKKIPYTEMVYNEVARGCYPSYYGETLNGHFEAYQPRLDDIAIEIPAEDFAKVQNIENCSVVAMLLKNGSGEIVNADIMPYASWTKDLSGVEDVAEGLPFSAFACGEGLGLVLPVDSNVCVCTIDGRILFNGNLPAGQNVLPAEKNQTLIVKAVAGQESKALKVVL